MMDKNSISKQQIVKDVTQRLAEIDKRLTEIEGERKTAKGRMLMKINNEMDKLKMEKTTQFHNPVISLFSFHLIMTFLKLVSSVC
jgi:DNA repair ATPase RecN